MRRSKYIAVDVWHSERIVCNVDSRYCCFAILDCEHTIYSDSIVDRNIITADIKSYVGSFGWSDGVARVEVANCINFVAGADGGVDVVLKVVIINVAADGSFGDRIIGAGKLDVLAVFLPVMIDEREVINNRVVEGIAIEWRTVIASFKADVAFNEAVIEVELAILFKAGRSANYTDIVWENANSAVIFEVINTHREDAVIRNCDAVRIIDFAVKQSEVAVVCDRAGYCMSAEI